MKPKFISQILFTHTIGYHIGNTANKAKELGYTMFEHNGLVYSVSEYLNRDGKCNPIFYVEDLL